MPGWDSWTIGYKKFGEKNYISLIRYVFFIWRLPVNVNSKVEAYFAKINIEIEEKNSIFRRS